MRVVGCYIPDGGTALAGALSDVIRARSTAPLGCCPYVAAHATPEQAWAMAGHVRARWRFCRCAAAPSASAASRSGEPIERQLSVAGRGADRVVVREVGGSWAAA
jgi:hypothetical protein